MQKKSFLCYTVIMKTTLPGVFCATKKDGSLYYRASLTYRSRHISLGSFDSESKAHEAYLDGCRILHDTCVTIHSYDGTSALAFSKWVSLLNFRDNGIYIATPIYIYKKFFEYYLSPDHILKFDLDELFFYSSHKIMKRGGHLFVADYGMQINVASRYGIKNYGVEGRDYRFVNGDPNDYRYENIEILNRYHGVIRIRHKHKETFQARIHVRSTLLIGRYESEIHAAIAYNKAIDILKKAGVKKQYVPNYIENLSPALYADIYNSLTISDTILSYEEPADHAE